MSSQELPRIRPKTFFIEEDYQLCKSWKITSEDFIYGIVQSSTLFWNNVQKNAANVMPSLGKRPYDSLRQTFGIIRSVSDFDFFPVLDDQTRFQSRQLTPGHHIQILLTYYWSKPPFYFYF